MRLANCSQREALLRCGAFIHNQERLDGRRGGVNISERARGLDNADNRQSVEVNTFERAVIDVPAENGKVADEPGFGVGEARANVNVSSTRFQIGPAYAGAILQAGGHQRSGEAKGQCKSLHPENLQVSILILPSF